MALLLLLIMGLTSLSISQTRSRNAAIHLLQARENARFAMMMAMGELQKSAGPDQRSTAAEEILPVSKPATTGRSQWAGVWDTSAFSPAKPDTKTFVRWLVSDSPADLMKFFRAGRNTDGQA